MEVEGQSKKAGSGTKGGWDVNVLSLEADHTTHYLACLSGLGLSWRERLEGPSLVGLLQILQIAQLLFALKASTLKSLELGL